MSAKKSERLKRIITIQRQKEKMAEIDLAITHQLLTANEASVGAAIEAMGSFNPIHLVGSAHYTTNLSTLDVKAKQLEIHRQAQEKKVTMERAKADRIEEKAIAARDLEDRLDEDENLHDLMDMIGFKPRI